MQAGSYWTRPLSAEAVALIAGARLGSYEVLAAIGAGGMGEVYRAHELVEGPTLAEVIVELQTVDVKSSGPTFEAGPPKDIFDSPYVALPHNTAAAASPSHTYAVSADGQRFLIPHPPSGDTANVTMPIAVVVNWAAGLRKEKGRKHSPRSSRGRRDHRRVVSRRITRRSSFAISPLRSVRRSSTRSCSAT